MLKYIFSRTFLVNVILALVVVIASITAAYYYLLHYTRQDEVVLVPDLQGYDLVEADAILNESTLEGIIVDSLYLPGKRGGEIVDQQPSPSSTVKQNRKIYLTIARYSSPMVKLPNITDQTLPLALAKLNSYGIEVGEIINKPSDCTDCVIGVEVRGKEVATGTPLSKGQKVNLIVGEGDTGEKIAIPTLYGLTADEAQQLANLQGLNIGATPYIDCENEADSAMARVFRQIPQPDAKTKISRGGSIDIFLSPDLTKVPPVNVDSLKAQIGMP